MITKKVFFLLFLVFLYIPTFSQSHRAYNLSNLLKDNRLKVEAGQLATRIADSSKQGITCNGIVWLKDYNFGKGEIEVDLRGRNVFQQSFLGIAFHGVDTVTYDAIYFRPFNFGSKDSVRLQHTVQYISEPNHPWNKLRKEHPLVYENTVNPMPLPDEWFHARIVVDDFNITVYVNNSSKPSLKVKKLNNRKNGALGLWTSGLPGDFANLIIKN